MQRVQVGIQINRNDKREFVSAQPIYADATPELLERERIVIEDGEAICVRIVKEHLAALDLIREEEQWQRYCEQKRQEVR